jgi:hypothetical protein
MTAVRLTLFMVPLAVATLAAAAGHEPLGLEMSVRMPEEFRWNGAGIPGQTVEINGIQGSLRAEPSTNGEVEIVAYKHGSGNPEDVAIEVVGHREGVTVCAVYPADEFGRAFRCRPSSGGGHKIASLYPSRAKVRYENGGGGDIRLPDVHVDFLVRLPAGVHFIGRTVSGTIEAAGVSGNVEAHTINGDVNVTLPELSGANVRAESVEGTVLSDYPLKYSNPSGSVRARGTVGRGLRKFLLHSMGGSVLVRRMPSRIDEVE